LANAKIQSGTFQQLAFFRISIQDGAEIVGGTAEVVTLQRLHAALVYRNGLIESGLPGRGRRSWRACWGRLWRCRSRSRSRRSRARLRRNALSSDLFSSFWSYGPPNQLGCGFGGPALLRHAPPAIWPR